MTKNNLENPIFLFITLLIIVTINTTFSIHFLLVMLCGILFNAFYICLKKRYIYSLVFVIFVILFVEFNSGLKPFSLVLLSLFLYIFIIPKIEQYISSTNLNGYLYILLFYFGLIIIWLISFEYNWNTIYVLIFNTLIDLIVFGLFI